MHYVFYLGDGAWKLNYTDAETVICSWISNNGILIAIP